MHGHRAGPAGRDDHVQPQQHHAGAALRALQHPAVRPCTVCPDTSLRQRRFRCSAAPGTAKAPDLTRVRCYLCQRVIENSCNAVCVDSQRNVEALAGQVTVGRKCAQLGGVGMTCKCCVGRCLGCYWRASNWGACSADCGNGSAQRAVQCLRDGHAVSPDAPACSNGCQPALKPQVCLVLSACMPRCCINLSQLP